LPFGTNSKKLGMWLFLCSDTLTFAVLLLAYSYLRAIQAAGALGLMIPPDPYLVEHPDDVLERLDGLILAGGADIDPSATSATATSTSR